LVEEVGFELPVEVALEVAVEGELVVEAVEVAVLKLAEVVTEVERVALEAAVVRLLVLLTQHPTARFLRAPPAPLVQLFL